MKRLVDSEGHPMEDLLGKKVTLLCVSYFYTGVLTGVNSDCVELEYPGIVYETGAWDEKDWKDAQQLPSRYLCVMKSAIEAFGELK